MREASAAGTRPVREVAVATAIALLLVGWAGRAHGSSAPPTAVVSHLEQLEGVQGCIAERVRGCQRLDVLLEANAIAISPDGRHVYSASGGYNGNDDTVSVFTRGDTGALALGACLGGTPRTRCESNLPDAGPVDFAISGDGRFVYVAFGGQQSEGGDVYGGSLGVYQRNFATGKLTLLTGHTGQKCFTCPVGPSTALVLSPDGQSLYVLGTEHGLVQFRRSADDGALELVKRYPSGPLSDLDDLKFSPDGRTAYISSLLDSAAVRGYRRDDRTGGLRRLRGEGACIGPGRGCHVPRHPGAFDGFEVSRDGRHVYIAWEGAGLRAYQRQPTSGRLRGLPGRRFCLAAKRAPKCRRSPTLGEPVATPDGDRLLLLAGLDRIVAVKLDPATGAMRLIRGPNGCLASSAAHGCRALRGLSESESIVVAPDGRNAYLLGERGAGNFVLAVLRDVP